MAAISEYNLANMAKIKDNQTYDVLLLIYIQ